MSQSINIGRDHTLPAHIMRYAAHIVSSPAGTPRTKSLARAIRLLHAVASPPIGSSASELARVTSLPRSTVARTLRTLADSGLVEEAADGGGWVLGYELVGRSRAADPHR